MGRQHSFRNNEQMVVQNYIFNRHYFVIFNNAEIGIKLVSKIGCNIEAINTNTVLYNCAKKTLVIIVAIKEA